MIFISNDITAFIRLLSLCSSTVILHVRTDELCHRPLSTNSQVPLCSVLKSCIYRYHETLQSVQLVRYSCTQVVGFFPLKVKGNRFPFCPSEEKDREDLSACSEKANNFSTYQSQVSSNLIHQKLIVMKMGNEDQSMIQPAHKSGDVKNTKTFKMLSPVFLLYLLQPWCTISRQELYSNQRQKAQILHSVTPNQKQALTPSKCQISPTLPQHCSFSLATCLHLKTLHTWCSCKSN